MPLARHIVLTAYGFWLPNDPRGSGSTSVGSWDLPGREGEAPAEPHAQEQRLLKVTA